MPYIYLSVAIIMCCYIFGTVYSAMREPPDELSIPLSLLISTACFCGVAFWAYIGFRYLFPYGLATTMTQIPPFWEPIVQWIKQNI